MVHFEKWYSSSVRARVVCLRYAKSLTITAMFACALEGTHIVSADNVHIAAMVMPVYHILNIDCLFE